MICSLTWDALQSGCAALTKAATPEVSGVAMDVPLMTSGLVPVPAEAEMMPTPGAATSGLTVPS